MELSMSTAFFRFPRRSERHPLEVAAILVIEGEEVDQSSLIVDLTPYGVRVQTAASLSPGQRVRLLRADRSGGVIDARVVWVGKLEADQAGQAGVEFLRPLASTSLTV